MTTSPPWQGISYVEDKRGKWWYEEGYGVRVYDGVSWLGHVAGAPPIVPQARVYKFDDQTITTGYPPQAIILDTENFDNDDIHDNATNNTRLTCKTAGTYLIIGNVHWQYYAGGIRYIGILLNGTTYLAMVQFEAAAAGTPHTPRQLVSTIWPLDVDDYVELYAYQDSGASIDILAYTWWSPSFMMTRLGGLPAGW